MNDYKMPETKGSFSLNIQRRIPLVLYRKGGKIFCASQFEIVYENGKRGSYYLEYSVIHSGKSMNEVGQGILKLLKN